MTKDLKHQVQQSVLANKMGRYSQAVRDLRLYFRGVAAVGETSDLPVEKELLEEALQEAEMLLLDCKVKATKESGVFDVRVDLSSVADITPLRTSA